MKGDYLQYVNPPVYQPTRMGRKMGGCQKIWSKSNRKVGLGYTHTRMAEKRVANRPSHLHLLGLSISIPIRP
ncbi:hypothetical protein COCNU_scaffold008179G000020 [Cocos nucifera]|nr:hypothetical protein [Cocos nucifera]